MSISITITISITIKSTMMLEKRYADVATIEWHCTSQRMWRAGELINFVYEFKWYWTIQCDIFNTSNGISIWQTKQNETKCEIKRSNNQTEEWTKTQKQIYDISISRIWHGHGAMTIEMSLPFATDFHTSFNSKWHFHFSSINRISIRIRIEFIRQHNHNHIYIQMHCTILSRTKDIKPFQINHRAIKWIEFEQHRLYIDT